ncbi:hypothetical protein LWI29_012286 [Acer saccharum]|uniref:Uncharacterized protein n=1 Tax=Acer saccharum TaxID=4024 RepID=A0AA39RH12_ACESA|nr:hypothetical protein LWI29_012286 [Acer saccharum]
MVAMVSDWSHFEVEEHGVKALQADRELRRNVAGDSFDRRSKYRRWSAHQRIRSPPPSHSVQEKLVDCFDVVKNVEENDKIEYSIFENFIQPMTEAFDLGVVMEVHSEPTNQVGEGINTIEVQLEELTIENIVFEDFVLMSHVLVCPIVSTLCFGFENVKNKGHD